MFNEEIDKYLSSLKSSNLIVGHSKGTTFIHKKKYDISLHWNRANINWEEVTRGVLGLLTLLAQDTDMGKGSLDFSDSDTLGVFDPIPIKNLMQMCQGFPPQVKKLTLNVRDLDHYSDAELIELGKSLTHIREIELADTEEKSSRHKNYKRCNYIIAHMGSQLPPVLKKSQIEALARDELSKLSLIPDLVDIILSYSDNIEELMAPKMVHQPGSSKEMRAFWKNRTVAVKYINDMKLLAKALTEQPVQPVQPVQPMQPPQPVKSTQAIKELASFKLQCLCAFSLVSLTALIVGIIAISAASGIPLVIAGTAGLFVAAGCGIFNRKEIIEVLSVDKPPIKPS